MISSGKSKQPFFAVPLGMSEEMSSRNHSPGDNYCYISRGNNLFNPGSKRFKPTQIYLIYFENCSYGPLSRMEGVTQNRINCSIGFYSKHWRLWVESIGWK